MFSRQIKHAQSSLRLCILILMIDIESFVMVTKFNLAYIKKKHFDRRLWSILEHFVLFHILSLSPNSKSFGILFYILYRLKVSVMWHDD